MPTQQQYRIIRRSLWREIKEAGEHIAWYAQAKCDDESTPQDIRETCAEIVACLDGLAKLPPFLLEERDD